MVDKSVYYEVGDNYTYECENDEVILGKKVSTCLSNLTWSLPPPTCVGEIDILKKHITVIAVL